jgi:ribonuclease HII
MNCRLTGIIAGLDEAGRGPLAGPVVSSCVAWNGLPDQRERVADSKLLREEERARLFGWVLAHAHKVGVGMATPREIERLNIHHATLLSMERALKATNAVCNLVLVDGLFPVSTYPATRAVVKGDRKCFFVACASIVAKVVRDRIMVEYDAIYPQYLFRENKGYPTPKHKKAIEQYGYSPVHRRTFKGVKELADGHDT